MTANEEHNSGSRSTVMVIAVLALLLYAPGFTWGIPHATAPDRTYPWAVDDETPLGAIGQVINFISYDPSRNVGYPRMHPILVTTAYAPYLGWLYLRGEITIPPSGEYPFGLSDPASSLGALAAIGHFLSVLLAVGIAVSSYFTASLIWNRITGVWASLFTMMIYPVFYYSKTGNVDVPMLFFLAAATACTAIIAQRGLSLRRSLALGACAAAALATKELAAGVIVALPLVVWATARHKNQDVLRPPSLFWSQAAIGVCFGLLVYGVTSGLLLDPIWFQHHVLHYVGRVERFADGAMAITHAYTLSGHLSWISAQIRYLATCHTPGVLCLALAGLVAVGVSDRRKGWLAWLAVSYVAFLFFAMRAVQLRYLLPLAFYLSIFAGRAVSIAWASPVRWLRYGTILVAVSSLSVGFLNGIGLTYEMIYDSRYAAADWLSEHANSGDRIEYFGSAQPLPALSAGIVTGPATEFRGMFDRPRVDDAKVEEILAGWRERQPRFIIVIPDHSSKNGQHSFVLPPQLFRAMLDGETPYALVAEFQTPPLLTWLGRPDLDYPTVNPPVRIFEADDE